MGEDESGAVFWCKYSVGSNGGSARAHQCGERAFTEVHGDKFAPDGRPIETVLTYACPAHVELMLAMLRRDGYAVHTEPV